MSDSLQLRGLQHTRLLCCPLSSAICSNSCPMQHCSLGHWTLLSPPNTSKTKRHFYFDPAASFLLELLVPACYSSPVVYWTPSNLGAHIPGSYLFAYSYCSWASPGQNTGVVCPFLFQWLKIQTPPFSSSKTQSDFLISETVGCFICLVEGLSLSKSVMVLLVY